MPTGQYIDPDTITTSTWSRVRLQVSGPRAATVPVLTTASSDHGRSGSTSYIYNDLRVFTGQPEKDDPRATRTGDAILYQLEAISNLTAGTYTVFVQARSNGVSFSDVNVLNFQVGTATPEKMVATSCTECHGDTKMHGSYPFNADVCKSCHDYEHQLTGKTGWNDSSWGFGAGPLSRRVHGVHFGHYIEKPEEIHGEEDAEHFGGIIFPMDVRNCSKCHSESKTWAEKPSRLTCLACHDSDTVIVHANIMTYDPTPADPWSGDEWETCTVCHGKGDDHSPQAVHAIADPFVQPYPREP